MPRDAEDINGHNLKIEVESHYGGKTVKYWCANEECYVQKEGEFDIGEQIKKLAAEVPCPFENNCKGCGTPIGVEAEICSKCHNPTRVGEKMRDYNENGEIRR